MTYTRLDYTTTYTRLDFTMTHLLHGGHVLEEAHEVRLELIARDRLELKFLQVALRLGCSGRWAGAAGGQGTSGMD